MLIFLKFYCASALGIAGIPIPIFHVLRWVFHSFSSAKIILSIRSINFHAYYFDLFSIRTFCPWAVLLHFPLHLFRAFGFSGQTLALNQTLPWLHWHGLTGLRWHLKENPCMFWKGPLLCRGNRGGHAPSALKGSFSLSPQTFPPSCTARKLFMARAEKGPCS